MVCRSVCLSVTIVIPAKTAEPIEIPFGFAEKNLMQDCMSYVPETVTSFSGTSFRYRFFERLLLALEGGPDPPM